MSLLQLLAQHGRPSTDPVPAAWVQQFRREQQVLPAIANLPRVIRAVVTGGR